MIVVAAIALCSEPPVAYFTVQRILNRNCIACHGGPHPTDGIDLRSYRTLIKGGADGKIVKPGSLKMSTLAQVLRGAPGYEHMPLHRKPLPESDIRVIEDWIVQGAKPNR